MDFIPIDTIGGLLAVVLGFGFIIFVHELGHFLVAKWVGIKCPQFAIGMGQAIVSYRKGLGYRRGSSETEYMTKLVAWVNAKRAADGLATDPKEQPAPTRVELDEASAALGLSETEYRLNWLPLGGYVKMLGQEDMDPAARSEDPRSFNSKPIWARAAVISAGVVMNIIFGILFFMIAFSVGVGFNAPVAGDVSRLSPAGSVYAIGHEGDFNYRGVRTGDQILTFNGEPVSDMTEVRINTALAHAEEKVRLEVERWHPDGRKERLAFDIQPKKIAAGLLDLGIGVPMTLNIPKDGDTTFIVEQLTQAGAEKAAAEKVQPGMRLVEAGGKKVDRYAEFSRAVEAGEGAPVLVVFEHPQTKARAEVMLSSHASMLVHRMNDDDIVRHLVGLVPAVTIKEPTPDMPAEKAGVLAGDVIVKVGDVEWPATSDVFDVVGKAGKKPITLVVLRGGEQKQFEITPKEGRLGIAMGSEAPVIIKPLPESPAAKLALPPGTRITAIDGVKVETTADMQRTLAAKARQNMDGFVASIDTLPNEGKTIEPLNVKLAVSGDEAKELAHAGWELAINPFLFSVELVTLQRTNPIEALGLGVEKTRQSMIQVYLTLTRVFQGSVHPKNFQGPVGIAHTGTKIAKQGWTYLIFFLGLISVNLAVINFLPIPIVDGGHIVFLIIEKIKGSPVGPRIQTAALFVGLALLACMFLYVTFNDIVRLFGLA